MEELDLIELLGYQRTRTITFSQFMEGVINSPNDYLPTSSSLISDAIKYFGFEIIVRNGEPIVSYNIFKDLFSTGINAVFGQEQCIKHIVDVIESFDNEAGLNRGIVLVGPPASGKTNIVDLIIRALEEYTKERKVKLFDFLIKFKDVDNKSVEIRTPFHHNPLLLIPITMRRSDGKIIQPRKILFDHIREKHADKDDIIIPNFYLNATLDKRTLDIIEGLMQNPRNKDKSLYDILEKYIEVEEIDFSTAQAKGIANIDETGQLNTRIHLMKLEASDIKTISEHLPGRVLYEYDGAIINSNRGILHIHDAFGLDGGREKNYKPLLMLLGSGKVSVESTQASVDNTVVITTNIEEMKQLDMQLDSSKLLDRIEKIPVNYLLDANAEMDILKRDMSNMRDKYDVDPNLLRIAAYYSVLTRLLPPAKEKLPEGWSTKKKQFYHSITPEQKLHIYASRNEDPVRTICNLPHWHSFHNELIRLNLDNCDPNELSKFIVSHPRAVNLRETGLFTNDELKMIDDEFMRVLWHEHYPFEGRNGISVRQLQNIMRNTIAHSDGRKIHVGIFLSQLKKLIEEGPELHHWLVVDYQIEVNKSEILPRKIGNWEINKGGGEYGDFKGLIEVVRTLYFALIKSEITLSTVDRNPKQIESDLRKYLQHILLDNAVKNKAFAHVMVPKYSFINPQSGAKVDKPNEDFMNSIENILNPRRNHLENRKEMVQKFLDFQSSGELTLEENKNVISSQNDNLLICFAREYSVLLSHRKVDEDINPEQLKDAFFHRKNDLERYEHYSPKIRDFQNNIILNMQKNFHYSYEIALDTVTFALRKKIINFKDILS